MITEGSRENGIWVRSNAYLTKEQINSNLDYVIIEDSEIEVEE